MADQIDPTAGLAGLRRSPVAHLRDHLAAAGGPAVSLSEEPFLTMVALRAAPESDVAARLGAALNASLPTRVGAVSGDDPTAVLWLAPDEWLAVSSVPPEDLTARLNTAVGGDPGQVVDVSANRATLLLSGKAARAVLEKGCPVDLHPRAFGTGTAVVTTLARVPVLLWQTGHQSYRLMPRSSLADYVARWLVDAMEEYAEASEPDLTTTSR